MIALKRAETAEELRTKPGLWRAVVVPNGARKAVISCPGCGEVNSLTNWDIAADGTVSPSVDHSWPIRKTDGTVIPSCTFHDHVKLEGWGEVAK